MAWEERLGITREEVAATVMNPEQVVLGHRGALVAQSRRGSGLWRVSFVETAAGRKILTLYWTSRVERHWQEE